MTTKELQDFISNVKTDISFDAKVYITNELGYIIVIQTAVQTHITIHRLSNLRQNIIRAIKSQFPDYLIYIHMILFNPREWPLYVPKIQQLPTLEE